MQTDFFAAAMSDRVANGRGYLIRRSLQMGDVVLTKSLGNGFSIEVKVALR
jgi:hypothetical protein